MRPKPSPTQPISNYFSPFTSTVASPATYSSIINFLSSFFIHFSVVFTFWCAVKCNLTGSQRNDINCETLYKNHDSTSHVSCPTFFYFFLSLIRGYECINIHKPYIHYGWHDRYIAYYFDDIFGIISVPYDTIFHRVQNVHLFLNLTPRVRSTCYFLTFLCFIFL